MTQLKISDDVMYTQVEDEYVLLHLDKGEYFSLNAMGREMFDYIKDGMSPDEIIDCITRDYEVAGDTVKRDLDELIVAMREARFFSEDDQPDNPE